MTYYMVYTSDNNIPTIKILGICITKKDAVDSIRAGINKNKDDIFVPVDLDLNNESVKDGLYAKEYETIIEIYDKNTHDVISEGWVYNSTYKKTEVSVLKTFYIVEFKSNTLDALFK